MYLHNFWSVVGIASAQFYILLLLYRWFHACNEVMYSLHGKRRFREFAVKMYRFSVTTRNVLAFIEHYTVGPLRKLAYTGTCKKLFNVVMGRILYHPPYVIYYNIIICYAAIENISVVKIDKSHCTLYYCIKTEHGLFNIQNDLQVK